MQQLTLFMIVAVTTFEFFVSGDHWGRMRFLPGSMSYVPELLGAAAAAYVVFAGVTTRFRNVRPAYWFAFGTMALVIVCSLIANHVAPGPIFAGLRTYFRAVPWFFVAAVFAFSERNIKQQFALLLVIAVIQLPFAIEQRIRTSVNLMGFVAVTGDWTVGTLVLSPTLTIFLISAICVSAAYFVRKRISGWRFLLLFFLLLIPTMINETKVTLIILPLGLLITFWYAADPKVRGRQVVAALALFAMFLAVFVPTYNAFMEGREYGVTIGEFFFEKENAERYLSTGGTIGVTGQVGRADSVVVPLQELAKDPVSLFFGYGIGNASHSALGQQFTGHYNALFEPFMITGFARIVLELGLLGLSLILIVYFLVFRDCVFVARNGSGVLQGFAAGWAGITAIMAVSIPYTDVIIMPSLIFLYWYFSGLIAAERVRISIAAREAVPAKPARQPALRPAYPKTNAFKTNV